MLIHKGINHLKYKNIKVKRIRMNCHTKTLSIKITPNLTHLIEFRRSSKKFWLPTTRSMITLILI